MNKAIFLDRDGVINEDLDYVYKVEDLKFIPRAVDGLKLLNELKYKLIIVTGQSGIGRGYYSEESMDKFHEHMLQILRKEGIVINAIYFCPHHAEKGIGKYKIECECRKPKTGMIDNAKKDFDIELKESYIIGDKTDDIVMGKNAGCKTILVLTGKAGNDKNYDVKPDFIAKDLYHAAKLILKFEGKK